MENVINETLNINLAHNVPPTPVDPVNPGVLSPDTGFFDNLGNIIGALGPSGCVLLLFAIVFLITGVVAFCLRRKFNHTSCSALSILAFILAFGFTIPVVYSVTNAADNEHTTILNVTAESVAKPFSVQTEDMTMPVAAPYGYTISAYFDNDSDNTIYNADKSGKINPITNTVADPAEFGDNTYGVKNLINNTYVSIPAGATNAITIVDINTPTSAGDPVTPLTYAVKLNTSIPEGEYKGRIVYTITPKQQPGERTFSGITKMQEMTAQICSDETTPTKDATTPTTIHSTDTNLVPTATLTDSRDNKTYQVAKLADGNCWMTENLRLGSATQNILLTPEDSNVQNDWTLPARNLIYSWGVSEGFTTPNFYPSDDLFLSDETKGTVGYYGYLYNWNAATAGTGVHSTAHATADICPQGWSLPANYSVNPNRSYAKLLIDYSIISSVEGGGAAYEDGGYTKMITAPLQFALSGSHQAQGATIALRGYQQSIYWSSNSSENSMLAYGLLFSDFGANPGYSDDKELGYPIRCLALPLTP